MCGVMVVARLPVATTQSHDLECNHGVDLSQRNIWHMKILVTGGLGLIGHNVVARLEQQGHNVVVTDTKTNYGIIPQTELDYLVAERRKKIITDRIYSIDIADRDGIDWIMRTHRPSCVIHLASFPRQKVVNTNPQLGSRTMSEGLLNLLEASKTHNVRKFVYISSSMVYGDFIDDVREDATCRPQGQYGIMKLAGEWLVQDYSRRGFFDHVIIRPSAVYGELDVEDRVISKFLSTAMRGGVLKVNGAGETLDFTYVTDAADGIVAATLSGQATNKIYNITKSHSWSLMDVANLAVSIVGKGTVEIRDKDTDFPSRGALNIDAARKDFGYNPQVDIEEGFQRYYDWLNDHPIYWSPKTV
jgi:nucleoside-diphosphate-sugar epimerase